MKFHTRYILGFAIAAFMLATLPSASATTCIYINGNEYVGNSNVHAFTNDGTGIIKTVAGSPYNTGGIGVGPGNNTDAQWDADGQIIANAAGTVLYVANGNSNNISIFTINSDCTLTAFSGSPVPSGGTQPASLALRENHPPDVNQLVVANKDSDPLQTPTAPNYVTFTVNADGSLTQNPGGTYVRPAGSSLAEVNWRPIGPAQFIGNEFMNMTLGMYSVNGAGVITQTSLIAPPFTVSGALNGSAMHPTLPYYYAPQVIDHKIVSTSYDKSGNLTFIKTSAMHGMAVCWLAMNAPSTRLVSAELLSHTLSVYDMSHPGTLTRLQSLNVSKNSGGQAAKPQNIVFDPNQLFLYIVDRNGVLHIDDVSPTYVLSETRTPIKIPLTTAGSNPDGIAVVAK